MAERDIKMENPRNYKIENVEMNWVKIETPVDSFGNMVYEMQIVVSKEQAEVLKANHFSVKEKDGKFSVNLRRKATKKDGSDNGKVRAVDADLKPIENTRIIGNGSVGNVIVWQYPYKNAMRSGVGNSLTAIQVTELKKYEATGGVDFTAVTGDAPAEPVAKTEDLF